MEFDLQEALRYLGADAKGAESLLPQAEAAAKRLCASISPRWTYRVFPLLHEDGQISIPDAGITLQDASSRTMLAQCSHVVLLACTLGVSFDAMLRAERSRDMASAVVLDACGSALVEAGCDAAEEELKTRFPNRYLTDRFSPGYGTLPLDLQPQICAALDTTRRLGIHVTDHFLMNPAKSVTAFIGLADTPQMARIRGCAYCAMRDTCSLRKGGKSCAT